MLATLLTLAAVSPADDLPLDEWIERAESMGSIAFRYRTVSADGEEATLHIAFDTPQSAHFVVHTDSTTTRLVFEDGRMTQLDVPHDGSASTASVDLDELSLLPISWHAETLEALGMADDPVPRPRARMAIWPSMDGDHAFEFNLSCGVSSGTPYVWLARLRHETYESELVDGVYVVRLESGAELTLDADDGFIHRLVIDPADEASGLLELEKVDVDPDLHAGPFEYSIPDDATIESSEAVERAQERGLWRQLRGRVIRKILDGEDEGAERLTDQREVLLDQFGALYTSAFRARIDELGERLEGWTDGMADALIAWFEANREREGVRERLEVSKLELVERLTAECQRGGRAMAQRLVVAPFESDSDTLGAFLEIEREAASNAIRGAFLEANLAHLEERLLELGDG